jgi:hypothetical protein
VAQFADDLAHYDRQGFEVYFAPASYTEERTADSAGKVRRRTRENVRFVKSLWLDIDVGDDKAASGKGYASLDLAIAAVDDFASKIEVRPTYVLRSGTGLHCYWAFREQVPVEEWGRVALALKRTCAAVGLLADPARTADATSVMRPVGTYHRKDPSNPREVSVLSRGESIDFKSFTTTLSALGYDRDPVKMGQRQDSCREISSICEYVCSLTEHAQLKLLDDACASIPDVIWSDYDAWIKIIAAFRGIRGIGEPKLLDLIAHHSERSLKWVDDQWDIGRLGRKFRSFRGGSIHTIFELAFQYGWRPRGYRDTPFESNERDAAVNSLTSRFIYVASQHMYFDSSLKELISPSALDESQFHLTQQLGSTPRTLLKKSHLTEKVSGIGYHPGAAVIYEEDGRRLANTYIPWMPKELRPTAQETEAWNWFILKQLFGGPNDQAIRDYFLDAIAYPLQHPGNRVASIPLLIGAEPGTGKSTLTEVVPRRIFGPRNVSAVTQAEIESNFNDWQAGSLILCFPEIWIGGHRDAEKLANRLKDSVTSPVLRIHPKGLKGYSQSNRTTMLATSNYENAVSLREGDRRWGVHVTNAPKMSPADAQRLYEFLNSDRAPGVLRWIFARRDLSDFNPFGAPPSTAGKTIVIAASRSDAEDAIVEAWSNNEFPFDRDLVVLEDIRDLLARARLETSLRKIGDFLRRPPISATRLSARPRLNARRPTPLDPYGRHYEGRKSVWAVRNVSVWTAASETAVGKHFENSSPPASDRERSKTSVTELRLQDQGIPDAEESKRG